MPVDAEFWLQAWQSREIGFHRATVHPLLTRYWPRLGIDGAVPVLVPLCGKSLDMCWLHGKGHPVTGVDLSRAALAQFVHENGLSLSRTETGFAGRGWRLIAADWFELSLPRPRSAFYDRAALVALPPEKRPAYVEKLTSLLRAGATGLLVTLEYRQNEMSGPPFSVLPGEVRDLFSAHASVKELERRDALHEEPNFIDRGLTALQEVAWKICLR